MKSITKRNLIIHLTILFGVVLGNVACMNKSVLSRYQSLKIIALNDAAQETDHLNLLTNKWLEEKGFKNNAAQTKDLYTLTLMYDPTVEDEGYAFIPSKHGATVKAACINGLYAGVGHFLLNSLIKDDRLSPPNEPYASVPQKKVRGMYFATHFHNFYHVAPIEKVQRYVEELALWGYNALAVWFDMHHFTGMDDPDAVEMVSRLRSILETARASGMKTGMIMLADEGFSTTPDKLKGEWRKQNGYHAIPNVYGVEICPNVPGGMELIIKNREEMLRAFNGIGLDYIILWPYDQGGCTCSKCAPWGAKGYLKASQRVAETTRNYFPNVKAILSTWWFDLLVEGELDAFKKSFKNENNYVSYILSETSETWAKTGTLQVRNSELCGLPVVGFPEISMAYHVPWGGYGANPMPQRIEKLWTICEPEMQGGFPYSEGIFEDANKYILSRMYWYGSYDVNAALKEYAAAYFSKEHAEVIAESLSLMETTLSRRYDGSNLSDIKIKINNPDSCDFIYDRIMKIDAAMSPEMRDSWRWRIIYLRAVIDKEISTHQVETKTSREVYKELIEIYYAHNALLHWVRPPLAQKTE